MKLVIIESPSKSQALKKYLGSGYEVFATKGHIRDLPTKSFGLDMRNNFEPNYINVPEKKQVITELKDKAERAEYVYIATDPDREGEAISWHVANVLGYPKEKKCRITFNEISKNAVTRALEAPREIDEKLVDAQQARRVLDRIVGYKLSPIICRKIAPKISAGRVQSVALKLVVDREREIEAFVPEEYWTVTADFEKDKTKFRASLATKGKKKFVPKNKDEVDALLSEIKGGDFVVSEVKKSVTKQHAPAPFITSTMQQDAGNKLGMSLARTTAAAQALYEGVEVKGEGKIALVTYIRTDSVRVSNEAQAACRAYIEKTYGTEFVPEKPNNYHTKDSAQDAHEAIRPISMDMTPERVKETLSPDNYKLYKLIYERFLASQMTEAQYASVSVGISAGDYNFKVSGKTMLFPGFTAVYKEFVEEENSEGMAGKLPILEQGETLKCTDLKGEQKFTKPPLRYTEARLVKAMEEKGIGRPATYTPTINVLTSRKYATKEGKELVPTKLGMNITDYLDQFFSSVINVKFTAHMEKRLDDVAEGEDWHSVVNSFWDGFQGLLEKADASALTMKEPPKETDVICPQCGAKMLLRDGRYGKFLGCSNFPKCRNIMQVEGEKKIVGKCPVCGKGVSPRKSKNGKTFYSCEGYPDCNFMSWDIPTGEKCPKCDGYLVRKGKIVRCSNRNCDYRG